MINTAPLTTQRQTDLCQATGTSRPTPNPIIFIYRCGRLGLYINNHGEQDYAYTHPSTRHKRAALYETKCPITYNKSGSVCILCTLFRSAYMLCLRLSDILDEQLETLGRAVIFPAGGMAEGSQRAGGLVDSNLHLFVFGLAATVHCV